MMEKIDEMLRDATAMDPPGLADSRILAAIGTEARSRRRPFAWYWLVAAASVAVMLGGTLYYGRLRETAIQADGELMLEITGMASVEDFYSPRLVAL